MVALHRRSARDRGTVEGDRVKRAVVTAAFVSAIVLAILVGPDDPNPYANAAATRQVRLVQGKPVTWWAHRTVQARKDANARARTVRQLREALRARVDATGAGAARARGLTSAFLCIHRLEGSWGDTRNLAYHGGLQMDARFETSYGAEFVRAWGHAYNWPPFVQVAVAMRAYFSGRGFHPWPSTARSCGLLR